jgi:exodeoxyribonuclease V alpha subunit
VPDTLKGVLERIVFLNEENHYTIAELRPESAADRSAESLVTVTGNLPGVQCGETLALEGEWVRHPKHGAQFRVAAWKSELPATVYGIRKYLGSGLVPGIGRVYANKIVDRFGADTLRVISHESARLREVPGIGRTRATAIKQAWEDQRALREVMIFLQTYGVGAAQCVRLVSRYGAQARQILTSEPYRVAREVDGIGFKTADRIALNLGFANDGAARLDAGLIFALETLAEEGHTAAAETTLRDYAAELLQTDPDRLAARLDALAGRHEIVRHPGAGADGPPVVQLPVYDRAEERIASAVRRLARVNSALPSIKVEAAIAWAQERAGFAFGDLQSAALRAALGAKISILTGGPGTGKTTALRALVEVLKAKKCRVHLAAPTGRAAQRLAETTGGYAQTIHRLLKYDPAKSGFVHHGDHPLATDFLIVDEASMLDTRLAAALLQAVPSAAHLLLVGDTDQLPSVGAGNVLKDLIASGLAPVTRLEVIYRQQRESLIVTTAHAVNRGEPGLPPTCAEVAAIPPQRDLAFVPVASAEECLARTVELCTRYIPERLPQFDPIADVQVLAPMHKGLAGVANLNRELQAALNPPRDRSTRAVRAPAGELRPGDKLIQLRNNYDLGLFNGDIAVVREADSEAGTVTADFDGTVVTLGRGELGDVALAYAISIHKSQGSEYPVVVIPLLKGHFMMLQRNLLYTGITRGKQRVFIVGEPGAWAMAVRNAESQERRTWLRPRLHSAP